MTYSTTDAYSQCTTAETLKGRSFNLLFKHLSEIKSILKPAVSSALYKKAFYLYLIKNEYLDCQLKHEAIINQLELFSTNLNIQEAFLHYVLLEPFKNYSLSSTCIQQALKKLQNKK